MRNSRRGSRLDENPLIEYKDEIDISLKKLAPKECQFYSELLCVHNTIHNCNFYGNSFNDDHCEYISKALQLNKGLEKLDLGKNLITSDGCSPLAKGLINNTSLRSLSLRENNIGEQGVEKILEVLSTTKIRILNLSQTFLADEGCRHFVTCMIGEHKYLKSLTLEGNYITTTGIMTLCKAITHLELESLSLADNSIGSSGCEAICLSLATSKTIKHLNLSKTYISNDGCPHLLLLCENKTLEDLNISKNNISQQGSYYIAEFLKRSQNLRRCDVSDNQLSDNGAQTIFSALENNARLFELNIKSNMITDAIARSLISLFDKNTSIVEINLSHQKFEDDGFASIAQGLKLNSSIDVLYLSSRAFSDVTVIQLCESLEANRNLKLLHLGSSFLSANSYKRLCAAIEYRLRNGFPLEIHMKAPPDAFNHNSLLSCATLTILALLSMILISIVVGVFTGILYSVPSVDFVMLGGFGANGQVNQTMVAHTLGRFCEINNCDFIMSNGDNFGPNGIRQENLGDLWSSFDAVYGNPSLNLTWYSILGDVDYRGDPQFQLNFQNNRWYLPNYYYSHRHVKTRFIQQTDVHFFMLDTTPMQSFSYLDANLNQTCLSRRSNITQQIQWLDNELAQSDALWKVLVGHHTLFGYEMRGNQESDSAQELIRHLKPLIDKYKLQVYLSGHKRNSQIFADDKKFTCPSTSAASQLEPMRDQHPYLRYFLQESGFMYIRVFPTLMQMHIIDSIGNWRHAFVKEID